MTSDTREPIETTDDAFLGGQLVIAQARQGSRAGIDAVFLAAACPATPGDRVLELGSGSGVVALAVARRVDGAQVTGVEIDPDLCALAARNAAANRLADRSSFICGDVTGRLRPLCEAGLETDSFDHAVANPPFIATGEGRLSPDERLARAHALAPGDLDKWVKALAAFVKPGDTARLSTGLMPSRNSCGIASGVSAASWCFPCFRARGLSRRVSSFRAGEGRRGPLSLARGMILHDACEAFTAEAQAILRHGADLELTASGNTSSLRGIGISRL